MAQTQSNWSDSPTFETQQLVSSTFKTWAELVFALLLIRISVRPEVDNPKLIMLHLAHNEGNLWVETFRAESVKLQP